MTKEGPFQAWLLKGPGVQGLVPRLWCYWEVVGLSGRKLCHVGVATEGGVALEGSSAWPGPLLLCRPQPRLPLSQQWKALSPGAWRSQPRHRPLEPRLRQCPGLAAASPGLGCVWLGAEPGLVLCGPVPVQVLLEAMGPSEGLGAAGCSASGRRGPSGVQVAVCGGSPTAQASTECCTVPTQVRPPANTW